MDQKPSAQSKSSGPRRAAHGATDAYAPRPEREPTTAAPPGNARGTNEGAVLPARFEPPISAIGPLFRSRLQRIHLCRVPYTLEIKSRATNRVLGGYYKSRRLVRIYAQDTEHGRRPLEELFDTFLHEIAHHLEYTEPQSFSGKACLRVPGRMHSRLFWRIFSDLKQHWARLQ
jgi:hypothetical protein